MNAPLKTCLQGGCACGAVRYRLETAPLIVHACHCGNCQRQTGAWHAVNALIESSRVTLLKGELVSNDLPTPSGAGQTIVRCASCQVAVWSNYHKMSKGYGDIVRFIRVGTLDEPWRLPPDVHIFTEDRNAASPDPLDAPSYQQFYDPFKVWSRASLRRLAALYPPELPGLHAAAHAMAVEQRT